jgi:hypothetical protein
MPAEAGTQSLPPAFARGRLWHEPGASAQTIALDPRLRGATIPVANIGETFGNLRNEVLVKHRRSSGRQNMVDQGVIVRPEGVYDR